MSKTYELSAVPNHGEGSMNEPVNNSQFVVSYELLELIAWLVEHEQETLKKIVTRALRNGLLERLAHAPSQSTLSHEELHYTVADFFTIMEELLTQLASEQETTELLHRNLVPSLKQVDTTACDADTIARCGEKASAEALTQDSNTAKELFCKELLKRWKPDKHATTH